MKATMLTHCIQACCFIPKGLLETLQQNNALLDEIQKCLEAYLESKRAIFPRYYVHMICLFVT